MVASIRDYLVQLRAVMTNGWDRFWFSPADCHTLSLIRLLTGLMLLYTHAVWSLDLTGFFGVDGRIAPEFVQQFHDHPFAWSYLSTIHHPTLLWICHLAALVVFALLTIGLWTRIVSVLAFVITVAYVHSAPGALFGLDQINCMLAMYLMVGDAGGAYSIDAMIRRHRGISSSPCVSTNIAIRLIQCHMCVIYLFAALGKLQGITWWEGTALWYALANLEYQTIDMTWLAAWPRLIELLTQLVLVWELSYIVLVWNRWTRPLVLLMAIPLHLGIAFCMGMITFGLIMLVGNLAFVSPRLVAAIIPSGAGQGSP